MSTCTERAAPGGAVPVGNQWLGFSDEFDSEYVWFTELYADERSALTAVDQNLFTRKRPQPMRESYAAELGAAIRADARFHFCSASV